MGIDTLVVIHPRGFPEKTLFAIEQYVMKGGNLLVFVDPNAISDRMSMVMGGNPSASPDTGFEKLMDRWGIELKSNTFAGDKYLSGVGRFSMNQPPGRLLPLLNCDKRCAKQYKDNITVGIKTSDVCLSWSSGSKRSQGRKAYAHHVHNLQRE